MTTRTYFHRLHGRLLATVLSVGSATAVTSFATDAHADVEAAACQVHGVLVSKEGDGKIPKDLEFLRDTLREDAFAAYRGYHLVDKKTLNFEKEAAKPTAFRSGHKLQLQLLGGDEKRLRMQLDLSARDGQKRLVKTQYTLEDNGLLLVDAGDYTSGEVNGKLFFTFQCRRR